MVFNSYGYALFLPVVLGAYWLLRHKQQNTLLLLASYVFYGAWDYRFLALMWTSTLTDYTVGRLLEATDDDKRRKRIFLVSLAVNLGILGFFKYFNFFIDSGAGLLRGLGFEAHPPTLRILLPIGISFYTFHGISYTFDVYRREIRASRSLLDFALFVAYFPQLVAGPIGRAQVQLPQIEHPRSRPSAERVRSGLLLILIGLFKKIAIADMLAPFVDDAFRTPGRTSTIGLLIGIYAFALQIYGDFSGYSDIARGSSRLFGIELLRNFEQPYLSRSITAFWRTWHISLSTWLRDYLYIPLGGNKRGELRTYRNLMLTMLLGGLWHGAAWTFVVWGGLHGFYLSVHRRFGGRRRDPLPTLDDAVDPRTPEADYEVRAPHTAPPARFAWRRDLLPALGTFHLVCLAWIFFRADSFHQAITYLGGILSFRGGPIRSDAALMLFAAAVIVAAIDILQRNRGVETPMLRWRPVARGVVYAAFVIAIIIFSGGTSVPFIYFQF